MKFFMLNINDITLKDITNMEERFPKRFDSVSKYKNEDDYKRRIGSSLLMMKALGDLEEDDISYNQYGKPMVKGREFSISHSGDLVVLAEDDYPIGIDVEWMNRSSNINIMKNIFQVDELKWMGENPLRFYTLWCQKESLSKAVGFGLAINFKKLDVIDFEKGKAVKVNGKDYFNKTFTYYDYTISITGENKAVTNLIIDN